MSSPPKARSTYSQVTTAYYRLVTPASRAVACGVAHSRQVLTPGSAHSRQQRTPSQVGGRGLRGALCLFCRHLARQRYVEGPRRRCCVGGGGGQTGLRLARRSDDKGESGEGRSKPVARVDLSGELVAAAAKVLYERVSALIACMERSRSGCAWDLIPRSARSSCLASSRRASLHEQQVERRIIWPCVTRVPRVGVSANDSNGENDSNGGQVLNNFCSWIRTNRSAPPFAHVWRLAARSCVR